MEPIEKPLPLTAEEEEQTRQFLRTNGPPQEIFRPDVPEKYLFGVTEREKYLLEMVSIATKQNEWLIAQSSGKKMALRQINSRLEDGDKRFEEIAKNMAPFMMLRERWLTGKNMVKHALGLVFTGVIMAGLAIYLAEFALEWTKRHLGWK